MKISGVNRSKDWVHNLLRVLPVVALEIWESLDIPEGQVLLGMSSSRTLLTEMLLGSFARLMNRLND